MNQVAMKRSYGGRVAAVIMGWAILVALAAASGILGSFRTPGNGPLILLGIALPSLAYFRLPGFRAWIEQVGLRRLTLIHAWRVPAALLFFYYGALGQLPRQFVLNAGVGDLLAGLAAIAVVALPMSRSRYFAMHAFGLADFVVAVGTGFYFGFTDQEAMAAISQLPLALIPFFGVGISGATHLMAFDLLRRRAGGAA